MKQEYATFVSSLEDLRKGQEVELKVLDLTPGTHKYEARRVKAIVADSPVNTNVLWVRFLAGILHPNPLGIEILEELPEVQRQ